MVEKTRLDKTLDWFKNKKIVVIIAIAGIAYLFITQIIGATKENRDNLFGEKGLLSNEVDSAMNTPVKFDSLTIRNSENRNEDDSLNSTIDSASKTDSKSSERHESSQKLSSNQKEILVEVSIYLDEKFQGYKAVYFDGKETPTSNTSTKNNPRIFIKNNLQSHKLSIITGSGDTCVINKVLIQEEPSKPIILIPNC